MQVFPNAFTARCFTFNYLIGLKFISAYVVKEQEALCFFQVDIHIF